MRKILKFFGFCMLAAVLIWFGTVLADRQKLDEDLIRLHVVAASDSEDDQALKLQVRDALVRELEPVMDSLPDAEEAEAFLRENLTELEEIVNRVIREAGRSDTAHVTLEKEAFDTRRYDTFSLPAGVYESLRVTIGEGKGRNWWCVVFPSLCVPASSQGFADTAAGSGFADSLTGALSNDGGYEVRFFFLDCLGRIENFFRRS
ncbi:MAG: stage II sporulation protein R [Firmicutes bacterium]|nr:stage II sporulation protein R [Bacillota bacterium]